MAISQITYTNKEALNENASIPDINKVKADDMNEIKSVVNGNATELTNTNANATSLLQALGLDRDTYNQLATYALGDIVLHENKIWECTTAIDDHELWNPDHWAEIPLLTNKINDKMLPTENSSSNSTKRSYSCDYVNDLVKDVYSTNEVKTNKVWVDDNNIEHPIYRLEIRNVTLTTGTGRPIYYNINNKDKTIAVGGMMTNSVQQIPIPSYFGPNTFISLLDQTNTNSLNYDMTGFTNVTATVYVEYTKTTD